jgi:hypothetical protein
MNFINGRSLIDENYSYREKERERERGFREPRLLIIVINSMK